MNYLKMSEKLYKMKMLRRKFYKRVLIIGIVFAMSFYGSVLLFGDLKVPNVMKLTSLDRCPACYGVSMCPELYSNQIIMENIGWTSVLNAKNIYYAYTRYNRRAVLKKLAHNEELRRFDTDFCETFDLKNNCLPSEAVNSVKLLQKIEKLVTYNLTHTDLDPRKGLVMCPYSYSIQELLKPLVKPNAPSYGTELLYIWTMLMINPEPIIIQLLPKSQRWPVPAYGGVCGRLELVAYAGEPISTLMHVDWFRRLKFANGILKAAMDFTFKHDRFRFYLMDWSPDNIVASSDNIISFVDLEDVIVLDKQISPGNDLPNWYKRYLRESHSGFSFSIDNICRHHLCDHNIWAACYVLAGEENPLLYPIPETVNKTLDVLLKSCLNGEDRFRTLVTLQQFITNLISQNDNNNKIVNFNE